jgi:hypothetical protein
LSDRYDGKTGFKKKVVYEEQLLSQIMYFTYRQPRDIEIHTQSRRLHSADLHTSDTHPDTINFLVIQLCSIQKKHNLVKKYLLNIIFYDTFDIFIEITYYFRDIDSSSIKS